MIKAKLFPALPDEVEVTMQLTMTLGEWKRLRDQLKSDYPSWRLSNLLVMLVNHYNTHFTKELESDGTTARPPE